MSFIGTEGSFADGLADPFKAPELQYKFGPNGLQQNLAYVGPNGETNFVLPFDPSAVSPQLSSLGVAVRDVGMASQDWGDAAHGAMGHVLNWLVQGGAADALTQPGSRGLPPDVHAQLVALATGDGPYVPQTVAATGGYGALVSVPSFALEVYGAVEGASGLAAFGNTGGLTSVGDVVVTNPLVDAETAALQRIAANNAVDGGSAARMARIDELSGANYQRLLGNAIDNQEYVYRYLSEKGLSTSTQYGSLRGYTTTEFSTSSAEVANGAQILPEWGVPVYGVRIPVSDLNGFSVARPMGNTATTGWEAFTNSYPSAGSGGWPQFLINQIPLDPANIFKLNP